MDWVNSFKYRQITRLKQNFTGTDRRKLIASLVYGRFLCTPLKIMLNQKNHKKLIQGISSEPFASMSLDSKCEDFPGCTKWAAIKTLVGWNISEIINYPIIFTDVIHKPIFKDPYEPSQDLRVALLWGYYGQLYSGDDFYTLSSGLTVQETTNSLPGSASHL